MKALEKGGDCVNYIAKTFPGLSMEKLKAGIFDGPQIHKLMHNQTFTTRMTVAERAAWCSYVSVIREFLGNTQASNYKNVVDVMLQNFQALDARMSIKLHYLQGGPIKCYHFLNPCYFQNRFFIFSKILTTKI